MMDSPCPAQAPPSAAAAAVCSPPCLLFAGYLLLLRSADHVPVTVRPSAYSTPRCATQLEFVACSAFCTLNLVQAEPLLARPACRLGFDSQGRRRRRSLLAAAATAAGNLNPLAADQAFPCRFLISRILPPTSPSCPLPLHEWCSSQPWASARPTRSTCCSRACRALRKSRSGTRSTRASMCWRCVHELVHFEWVVTSAGMSAKLACSAKCLSATCGLLCAAQLGCCCRCGSGFLTACLPFSPASPSARPTRQGGPLRLPRVPSSTPCCRRCHLIACLPSPRPVR